jgi:hypothetical protein
MAVARPMPLAPPVTMTRRPFNPRMEFLTVGVRLEAVAGTAGSRAGQAS